MRWIPFALVLIAAAQNAPPSSPAPETNTKKSRIDGTIFSLNGDAIRKATVRLQGSSAQPGQPPVSYSEATDNAGKFVFEDIPPGRYTLSAEKSGFVPARYGARSNTSPGTQLTVTAATEMKDLSIKMTPQGVIAGKVVDEDGDPVPTVQVQVLRTAYVSGRRQLLPSTGSTTNDLGEYRLSNLSPGRYYIGATDRRPQLGGPADRPGRPGAAQEGYIPTFYPNGVDVSSALPVDVAAGGEMRGIDIHLIRSKVYTVRGKASEPPPAGNTSVLVSLNRKDQTGPALPGVGGTSTLRPDGSFEFRNLVPGTYILQTLPGNINGNAAASLTGRLEVTVGDKNIEDLVLPLAPAQEIQGTVKLEGGEIATLLKPAQNASGAQGVLSPGRISLVLTAAEGPTSGGTSIAQVKDDGTFRFNAVAGGKYLLNSVLLPPGTYLKAARIGGQDVTHTPIDTTSGGGGPLEVVLSSKAADVSGSVQNDKGEPQAGIMVVLWPKSPDGTVFNGSRPGITDQRGGFRIQSVPPGDYFVAAFEDLDSGLAQSPDFLNHFTSDASSLQLSEGSHETRDLKPLPSDKVLVEVAKVQ